METSHPLDDNFTTGNVNITEEIKSYLYETAKWGKFLSIVAFVFIGLMVIFMLFILVVGGVAFGISEEDPLASMSMGFIIVFYGLMIAMYFFPTLYLYRFSTKMKTALDANDQQSLSESFMNMKSVFKFWGIFTAVFVGFYAIGILGSLAFGGLGMFM